MERTWWVNVAFGLWFALALVANVDGPPQDLRAWALVLVQIAIAGMFFFEGGRLWARRSSVTHATDRPTRAVAPHTRTSTERA